MEKKDDRDKRRYWITIAIVVSPFVLLGALVELTGTPRFCTVCHIMRPYFRSWRTSSHSRIRCTECHYTPGFKGTLRGKFTGLAQLAKYITGTQGPIPRAEIEDASCVRNDCHLQRLEISQETFKNVRFDHKKHMGRVLGGRQLRCVNCYSQIVQGQHITDTETTCFLCHFKGQKFNQGRSRCTLCHEIPTKKFTLGNITYDHSIVKEMSVDCWNCHSDVIKGDGFVPQHRCLSCHDRPEDVKRYADSDFVHHNHVTAHKVDCLDCHIEIRHSIEKLERPALSRCSDCHENQHKEQIALYTGNGDGVKGEPNPMFAVRAGCRGCHIAHTEVKEGEVVWVGSKEACQKCHGEGYGEMLKDWKSASSEILKEVEPLYGQVHKAVALLKPSFPDYNTIISNFKSARKKLELVRVGKAVHNVNFALELIEQAQEELQKCKELLQSLKK